MNTVQDPSFPQDPESDVGFQPLPPKALTLTLEAPDPPDTDPQNTQISIADTQKVEEGHEPSIVPKSSPIVHQDPQGTTAVSTAVTFGSVYRGSWNKKSTQKKLAFVRKCQPKLDHLVKTIKPIPFVPERSLDFARHEELLKLLGLWDFVHLDFERGLRTDLIAELIATYSKSERGSYVKGLKVHVNRADLARALKIHVSKKKDKVLQTEIAADKGEINFLMDFMLNWVFLHDDMWMMPDEVCQWTKWIQEGNFEKVDWAAMLWFMVDKELQAPELENCYYASHLQCVIRNQREGLFKEEIDGRGNEETLKMPEFDEQSFEQSLELSLGLENTADADDNEGMSTDLSVGKKEELVADKASEADIVRETQEENVDSGKDCDGLAREVTGDVQNEDKEQDRAADVMDLEECKEEGEEQNRGLWLLGGKKDSGEHFLQRCSSKEVTDMDFTMDQKEEGEDDQKEEGEEEKEVEDEEVEEEEEEEEMEEEEQVEEEEQGGFNLSILNDFHSLSPANLIHVMENSQMEFGSDLLIRDNSCGEFLASRADPHLVQGGSSSVYVKREIDHDHDHDHDNGGFMHPSLNGSNKRMRTESSWDNNSMDFHTCMEQAQQWMEKAKMAHEAEMQKGALSEMDQQRLLHEVERRDRIVELLQKAILEEQQKAKRDVFKLERDLFMMENLLDGYKKALKETDRKFAAYRARCPEMDEPYYKDVPRSGGLVLGAIELEKQRVKKEEEEKMKLVMLTEQIREFDNVWTLRFQEQLEGLELLEGRLLTIVEAVNGVKEFVANPKDSAPEATESALAPEITESPPVLETTESAPVLETESAPAPETEGSPTTPTTPTTPMEE